MTAVAEETLRARIAARLADDPMIPSEVEAIVLAALTSPEALDDLLENGEVAEEATPRLARSRPVGAYVNAVTVEGFRGVGRPATLTLTAGPGLTLVIGRNGSGKSSFAEALEMLFTGNNRRWATRSVVWREGWRNLHHPTAAIEASLAVEGVPGATVVRRQWVDGADLGDGAVDVQPHGEKRTDLTYLGWEEALVTYRPFLSYSELGSMFDEGPTKLHDAISVVLGLEELPAAEKALKDARLVRERAHKAVLAERDAICAQLNQLDDDRARIVSGALAGKHLLLDVAEQAVVGSPAADTSGELAVFARVVATSFASHEALEAIARELREAREDLLELAGTQGDRLLRSAELLEQAVAFRAEFEVADCPVCGTAGVLDDEWAVEAARAAEEQKEAARGARNARTRVEAATRQVDALFTAVPKPVQDARTLLNVQGVVDAWREWLQLRDEADPAVLAARLPDVGRAVRDALARVQEDARREVDRRQDAWRPVAIRLGAWLKEARSAQEAAAVVPDLKRAEKWLKENSIPIRNERFAPIADEAADLWALLRQRSNVRLGKIELEGSGARRRVTLDVTVDGVPGAALGVMSQGELHALALSLFFPRATLPESPFRFVVVDDPVQSMDPAKVDGLARVLERAARTRQVIVFTHDDRLPQAIRRLGIEATTVEVSRGEQSVVELRPALTPVERHIEDARAVISTADLPGDVAARVVPGFCRFAIDAACMEAVRRRRIGRGDAHAEVERELSAVTRTTVFAALALFDDGGRGGDVLATINSRFGRAAADAFKRVNQSVHTGATGDLRELVREAAILARKLAELP
jgi:energy-coupling factor transporter ATP-binding protein EcfA2